MRCWGNLVPLKPFDIQIGIPDVVVDSAGNLYIADRDNHRVRKVSPSGIITTIAGTGEADFSGDGGPATSAAFYFASTVSLDAEENLYVSDTANGRVRKVQGPLR